MSRIATSNMPPALGPDDPPTDFGRELAAFGREKERLVRNHLGKIALVHQDEVVGAFATADEAILEGFRRFGHTRMMLKEIRDPDPPDFVSLVDFHHPVFQANHVKAARSYMGKFSTAVEDLLILPARVQLTRGQEQVVRLLGRPVPAFVAVRLIIDTGSKRSTLAPSIIAHLNPLACGSARIETSLATAETNLYWLRLEFPGTPLAAIPEIAVARLALPTSLASCHGVIGRDLLSRWDYVLFEGLRNRLTIRDSPPGWLSQFMR